MEIVKKGVGFKMTLRDFCETVAMDSKIAVNDGKPKHYDAYLVDESEYLDCEVLQIDFEDGVYYLKVVADDDEDDTIILDLSDFEKEWNRIEELYRKSLKDKKLQGDIDWLAARIAQFGQHLINCSDAIAAEYFDRNDDSFTLTIDSVVTSEDDEHDDSPYLRFSVI